MVDLRKIVFRALKNDPELESFVEGRIFQRGSMPEGIPPGQLPYIVYHLNESFGTGISILKAQRQSLQVWVHDKPGDYFQIDEILDRTKKILEHIPEGTPPGFLGIRHLQYSPDLWDDLLKHIVRNGRFAATMTELGEANG